ncbi:glycosyltransferase [Empedobacter sp. 225-1]|uniref:glycosyltransferase n=1 Tax=unclassified Empedobacter TaxID=2643773 RepID=UPI002576F84C|nr:MULTISPECIES: glycosyltransferase [unclassified Empedobacter]MDM1524163.1 glycosyltransferase [Empedobacter sp. 225-1]MDM1544090.1 glycosyltransferase [Empedobacter sp. 189-2]
MKILSAVLNNIETDQRLDKVCHSLLKFGYDVELIGATLKGKPNLNKPYKTHLIEMNNQSTMKMYAEFNWKLFFTLLKKTDKKTILLANDLDSLFPFYLVSKIKNRPLVFDSHEIFSELPSLQNRPKTKKIWKTLEQFLLPKINHFYTVSDGYVNWFHKEYGANPVVIRNVPNRTKLNDKQDFIFFRLPENPTNDKILMYQGAINMSRGIDKMIEAFKYVENCQFWIAGEGPKKAEYEQLVKNLNLTNRIHFLGNIPPKTLKTITPLADVGMSLEEDLGLSYRYALPNKLFDFIQARVPILATNLPEIKKMVEEYNVGKVIINHEPKHLAETLQEILNEGKRSYQENLAKAAKELCWENEEIKLKAIFEQIKK